MHDALLWRQQFVPPLLPLSLISSLLTHDFTFTTWFTSGLGRRKGRDEDWIEHQDAFDQILANLNSQAVSNNASECSNQTAKDASPLALLETAAESKRLMYNIILIIVVL